MSVRPVIVSGVSEEQAVDLIDVLLATVKGHVQTALCPGVRVVFAVRRHVEIACLVQARARVLLVKKTRFGRTQ